MSHRSIIAAVAAFALLAQPGCTPEAPEQPEAATAEGALVGEAAPATAPGEQAAPAAQAAQAAPAEEAAGEAAGEEAAPSGGIAGIAGVAPAEQAAVEARIPAEHFDLEKVTTALREKKIEDGDGLEKYINDRDNGITRVDVDGDGKVDLVQIEEVREADAVRFEVRAIPSRSREVDDAVTIAVIRIRPERAERRIVVVSEYDAVVIHEPHHRYEYVEVVDYDDNGFIVLGPRLVFFSWLFRVERPVYESVVVYTIDHTLVRPHRPRPLRVVHIDDCWPPGHCKHHHKHKRHKKKYYKKRGKKRGKHKHGKHH